MTPIVGCSLVQATRPWLIRKWKGQTSRRYGTGNDSCGRSSWELVGVCCTLEQMRNWEIRRSSNYFPCQGRFPSSHVSKFVQAISSQLNCRITLEKVKRNGGQRDEHCCHEAIGIVCSGAINLRRARGGWCRFIHNENRGVIGVNGTVIASITTRNILFIWGRVWISVGDVLMFETKLLKLQWRFIGFYKLCVRTFVAW